MNGDCSELVQLEVGKNDKDDKGDEEDNEVLKRRTGGCRMHGRQTRRADRSYEIRWGERNTERDGKAERIAQG